MRRSGSPKRKLRQDDAAERPKAIMEISSIENLLKYYKNNFNIAHQQTTLNEPPIKTPSRGCLETWTAPIAGYLDPGVTALLSSMALSSVGGLSLPC